MQDNNENKEEMTLAKVPTGLLWSMFALGVTSVLVKYVWNDLMPSIGSLPQLTFIQAFELTVLCDMLFKTPRMT